MILSLPLHTVVDITPTAIQSTCASSASKTPTNKTTERGPPQTLLHSQASSTKPSRRIPQVKPIVDTSDNETGPNDPQTTSQPKLTLAPGLLRSTKQQDRSRTQTKQRYRSPRRTERKKQYSTITESLAGGGNVLLSASTPLRSRRTTKSSTHPDKPYILPYRP